jgi:hypothetical protein
MSQFLILATQQEQTGGNNMATFISALALFVSVLGFYWNSRVPLLPWRSALIVCRMPKLPRGCPCFRGKPLGLCAPACPNA